MPRLFAIITPYIHGSCCHVYTRGYGGWSRYIKREKISCPDELFRPQVTDVRFLFKLFSLSIQIDIVILRLLKEKNLDFANTLAVHNIQFTIRAVQ